MYFDDDEAPFHDATKRPFTLPVGWFAGRFFVLLIARPESILIKHA
jgi:hypothetical protein